MKTIEVFRIETMRLYRFYYMLELGQGEQMVKDIEAVSFVESSKKFKAYLLGLGFRWSGHDHA